MAIETVPNSAIRYYLLAHDADGRERADETAGSRWSERIMDKVSAVPITDVFIVSHGWKGDIPAARDQYNRWIAAMLLCRADIARVRAERPDFQPLIIGFHWPSLPWGDEELGGAHLAFDPSSIPGQAELLDRYAERIADTQAARAALESILAHAAWEIAPPRMPAEVVDAYRVLDSESGLGNSGPGAAPGMDREGFDPELVYDIALASDSVSFGAGSLGGLLAPLRQLSFWKMKARARHVGETAGAGLVRMLQSARASLRIHLIGHSFGCIVVSGMVRGADGSAPLHRPLDTLLLVQGAMSLWSFSASIPVAGERPGYYSPVIQAHSVSGPVLTTCSAYDTAVCRLYPLAAGAARQVSFAVGDYPKYGALGEFGARGEGVDPVDLRIRSVDAGYEFEPARLYNLEASTVIREGGGLSGAHNDIARVEIAHALWTAAFPPREPLGPRRAEPAPAAGAPSSLSAGGPARAVPHPPPPTKETYDMEEVLTFNGVDGATGQYLVPPISMRDAVSILRDPLVPDPLAAMAERLHRIASIVSQPHLGLPWDVDPARVDQAGWGIVFHADESKVVRNALAPLMEWRARQVGSEHYHVFEYHTGETWARWLQRHGAAPGSVDPTQIPYYLLIVGDPALISFEFCHQLDIEYAIGRLHFDTPDEYGLYARSVVEYEKAHAVPNAREVVYFAPRHEFDAATQLSADHLVAPLSVTTSGDDSLPAVRSPADTAGFRTRRLVGPDASKEALHSVFSADTGRTPAVVFSASHGMGWPLGHPRQRTDGGALLCQDWPGIGAVAPEHYYAAADVGPEARLGGMITIHFACYGAGTPETDRFLHKPGAPPPQIAPQAFIAALPQRLLAHPSGGALACIGHVERAWGYSITPRASGPQLLPFRNLLGRILNGQPAGHALKDLNERFAVLSSALSTKLEYASYGRRYPDYELVADWIERNDAEGYLLLGDPAVSLRVADLS